jgi:hypothetical protein
MAKISTYPDVTPPALDDYLVGTDVSSSDATKSFVIADVLALWGSTLQTFANNSAAISGGIGMGMPYKTSTGELRVVV